MSYPESVRYLYALGNELKAGAKFGLERMQLLLCAMGSPEAGQRFVHVAGTNGKGSTSAMIANSLQRAGFRTGLYTSPHLVSPTERIQIDGSPVSEQEFASAFEVVHDAAEKLIRDAVIDAHPSYFETVTAMAFLLFRSRCDISVIEVGLGGRLDATNVIVPELCVITPIAFDHEAFLGNTLASIAGEKAGILKPGVPAITTKQLTEAEQVVFLRAKEIGCQMIVADTALIESLTVTAYGSQFVYEAMEFSCPLPGRHQVENALTAIRACQQLGLRSQAIQNGIASVRWPGRLERIASAPDLFLDGAHNPAGAYALAHYIREFWAGKPVWMIYGAMRDKAIDEVTAQLFPLADRLILTAPDMPRALRPQSIADMTEHPSVNMTENLREALSFAKDAPREGVVFVTGSLYLVGEARAALVP